MKRLATFFVMLFLISNIFAQAPVKRNPSNNASTSHTHVATPPKQTVTNKPAPLNGYHEKTYSDGRVYKGNFKNDLFDGYGELKYPNGDYYRGDFKRGKKDGNGVIIYSPDSWLYSKYEGEFVNDKYNGIGTLYWKGGGLRHTGNFKNDEPYGQGTTFYDQHDKGTNSEHLLRSEGFYEGVHMIKGTIYYYNHDLYEKYIGECSKSTGNPSGTGKMFYRDGRIYEGQMLDHAEGNGKMTYPDGRVVVGVFERGALKK